MRKTNEINLEKGAGAHAMTICGQMLYIYADNGKVYEYEVPRETLWDKLFKLLALKKYSNPPFQEFPD